MALARYGQIEGMKEARAALAELGRATQTSVGKRALKAPARLFAALIKSRAPVSDRANDPTPGSLRDSVKAGKPFSKRGQARIEVVIDDVAAVPNEYGTHKMHARPFARPAVDFGRAAAALVMAEEVKKEIDAAVARVAKKGGR